MREEREMLDTSMVWLFGWLLTKHFIVDFPMQIPYMYQNKGEYGHPGGLLHALWHGIGTLAVLIFFTDLVTANLLAGFDMFIHYHIDWAKMNLNKKFGWGPTTHEQFWWLLGLDQYLHGLTYVLIVAIVIS
jgi:hypothetical protein